MLSDIADANAGRSMISFVCFFRVESVAKECENVTTAEKGRNCRD